MPFLAPLATALTTGLTTFFTGLGFSAATAGALASATLKIGASLLISTAVNAIFAPRAPKAQDVSRELSQPTTAPSYRFVYGETRAAGTPAGNPVRGIYLYGCWILNSRPSYLPDFTLFLDKRQITLTGDAFDLTEGGGATSTDDLFDEGILKVWIGRGDQTAPPWDFTDEVPWVSGTDEDLWKATDAWQGRTVIWMRLDAGKAGARQERWPSAPPLVEVEGKWSYLWDPRDAGQDPDDPDTWTWSENHRLCLLDALMQNPVRAYRQATLHMQSFEDAADIADQNVALKAGGTEKRYVAAGTVVFDSREIEDQLIPLATSGAADFIRIGGQLGVTSGAYEAPSVTVTDVLGTNFSTHDLLPEEDLVNQLRVSYLSRARGYETANLMPWDIPGALAEDGGVAAPRDYPLPFCPSPTQAMRVRKIAGLKLRRQEGITCLLPPEAIDLVGGATVTMAIDDSVFDAFDGIYEVQSIHPGLDPIGEGGEVALRLPAVLIKHSSDVFAWTPATDEEDIVDEPYDGTRQGVQPPGAISAVTGPDYDLDTGDTILTRIYFSFDPSDAGDVTGYDWEFLEHDGDNVGNWTAGGTIGAEVRDASDDVFAYVTTVNPAKFYDLRVRTVSGAGLSDWVTLENVAVDFTVTVNSATAGIGQGSMNIDTPDMANFAGVKVYRSAEGAGFGAATAIGSLIPLSPSLSGEDVAFGDTGATNLAANGSFDSTSDWTAEGDWSIAAGVASKGGSGAARLRQDVTLTPAADYRFHYTRTAGSGADLTVEIIGDTTADATSSAAGTFQGTLTCPANGDELAFLCDAFDGDVDDVVLYADSASAPPQGSGDFYLVPVTNTGTEGPPTAAQTLFII